MTADAKLCVVRECEWPPHSVVVTGAVIQDGLAVMILNQDRGWCEGYHAHGCEGESGRVCWREVEVKARVTIKGERERMKFDKS